MWGSEITPRPFTAESLKIIKQKQLAQKQREKEKPFGKTKKPSAKANHPEIRFRTGNPLPKHMRLFFTPDMMNIPLEDFDPFYAETKILKAGGQWPVIYFVVTIFLGSFYTLNILLAVVSKSYDDLQKERKLVDNLEESRCSKTSLNVRTRETNLDHAALNTLPSRNHEGSLLLRSIDLYCKNPIKTFIKSLGILLNTVAFDPFTELIMAMATVANLVLLSVEHYRMEENQKLYAIFVSGYQILSFTFALDCLLKFLASGPISYFKNAWNIFDFILVVFAIMDYLFDDPYFRVLGSIRSFRVFKLARIWPTLNTLVETVFSSIGNVSDMSFVAIGIFYLFCVAGMHLFRLEGVHNSESSWHFGDFWHSFMVIFRILCGEWTETMWECFEANGPICIPFYITAVIVLNLIVLNLLLVMFLQRFSAASIIKNGTGQNVEPTQIDIVIDRFRRFWNWIKSPFCKFRCTKTRNIEENQVNYGLEEARNIENVGLEITEEQEANETLCKRFKFRTKLVTLLHMYFKIFSIGITIICAISLSLNDVHLDNRPWLQDVLRNVENLGLTALCLETFVKISAVGFSSYIKISLNRLDLIILLGSVITEISYHLGFGQIAFFKSIRVFRLFSNFEGMRTLFNSLGKAMSKIFGVLMVCLLTWLVFAIIGVQLLNGRLYTCLDPEDGEWFNAKVIKTKLECLAYNFTWENSEFHFDNVGSAYYCILQIITFKGWLYILYGATSSGEIDEQPSFEKRFWISGYFVLVILGGSFFAFNLFIGIVIDCLNEEKRNADSNLDDKHENERIYMDTRELFLRKLKKFSIGSEKV
ncbi:unnamed protein product [Orchesella dallaii]|uniref:Ion transport domain-containing protein n=1 Tax=Orchesella dallaii TaxID=48710 RepID=A0ABP1QIW3_9HEXA